MSTLPDAMMAGVLVEFIDDAGACLGRAVFLDWHGKMLPLPGDRLSAGVGSGLTGSENTLVGVVKSRHFEVQQSTDGRSEVWARLEVRTAGNSPRSGAETSAATPAWRAKKSRMSPAFQAAIRYSNN